MKTELVKLSQIRVNGANPRIIKDDKFAKLVNSILDFPKMLELRPIVVDDTLVCLGGNMRYRALTFIAEMPIDDLKSRLCDIRGFQKKTEAEKEALVEHWERWQDNPTAPIIRAADLSDEEQKEFIIKDNVGYGEWDYDMLANDWEAEDLEDWGLDVWQSDNNDGGDSAGESSKPLFGRPLRYPSVLNSRHPQRLLASPKKGLEGTYRGHGRKPQRHVNNKPRNQVQGHLPKDTGASRIARPVVQRIPRQICAGGGQRAGGGQSAVGGRIIARPCYG